MLDPNLFHIDWERTLEALIGVIILSFLVERACSLVFDSRWYIRLFEDARVCPADEHPPGDPGAQVGRLYPIKELGAFALAAAICTTWDIDAISIIFLQDKVSLLGELVTAGVVAGGSKASIKLFRDIMGIRSTALREKQRLRDVPEAEA